ncbi:unnamed protein product [Ambrosiozyma monospora]|uniref:Unnamed protein product n=1 Tax=Ambrosiozyma monospora TaxID=43982 RepID=A0A9W6YPR7_AMBMO|nr:unnamed protein product [Ambrosiozyma monospora]
MSQLLSSLKKIHFANPPNRVLQYDAQLLDDEVFSMLNKQVTQSLSDTNLPTFFQRLNSRYSKELGLLLKLLIFKFTIWDKDSSYGLSLQNLRLSGVNGKRSTRITQVRKLLLLASIVSSHLLEKLESYLYSLDDDDYEETTANGENSNHKGNEKMIISKSQQLKQTSARLVRALSLTLLKKLPLIKRVVTCASFLNFLIFLFNGEFPTLLNRLLQIKYTAMIPTGVSFASNPETISYEFQDRQLIWNTLTEFLVFIVPALSIPKLIRRTMRFIKTKSRSEENDTEGKDSMFKFLPERCCAVCYQNASVLKPNTEIAIDDNLITNPYEASCGHIYCYYCLVVKLEEHRIISEEEGATVLWNCLRCGQPVEYCRVYDGDAEYVLGSKIADISSDEEDEQDEQERHVDSNDDNDSDDDTNDNTNGYNFNDSDDENGVGNNHETTMGVEADLNSTTHEHNNESEDVSESEYSDSVSSNDEDDDSDSDRDSEDSDIDSADENYDYDEDEIPL